MLATAVIARRTLTDATATSAMRVLGDPLADPNFTAIVREYFGHGRLEMASMDLRLQTVPMETAGGEGAYAVRR
jgi:hypothetical protein